VSTEVDAQRDKLATVVGQKFTIFATVDVLPTILASLSAMSVYLSAQHDPYSARRAGPSATVDSCDVQSWNDARLKWDPAEFDSVQSISLPSHFFWIPDIALYNK